MQQKLDRLKGIIRERGNAAVAFSGGVDSSFLARVCHDVLGDRTTAFIVDTLFMPRSEIESARRVADEIGVLHRLISLDLENDPLLENAANRCYFCKKKLFFCLREHAQTGGFDQWLDGSNQDDLADDRPGFKAIRELGFTSPLIETGFHKQEIREASRYLGLSTWNLPSQACLASRIPHGQRINRDKLRQIEAAECFLKQQGIRQVRVRHHGPLARIEVAPEERSRFFDSQWLDQTAAALKRCGFHYITLDLEGYQTGKGNIPSDNRLS